MKSREQIYYILKSIDDASDITPEGNYIRVTTYHEDYRWLYNSLSEDVFEDIVLLLKQKNVIEFIKYGSFDYRNSSYLYFVKLKNFDEYLKNLEEKILPVVPVESEIVNLKGEDIIYELLFDEFSGQISIMDYQNSKNYLLKTLQYSSEYRAVFAYLFKHPGIEIKIETLNEAVQKEIDRSLIVPLHKVVSQSGFNKKLKKLFFITTKNKIMLRKKVTLQQLNKSRIEISDTLKNLSQI